MGVLCSIYCQPYRCGLVLLTETQTQLKLVGINIASVTTFSEKVKTFSLLCPPRWPLGAPGPEDVTHLAHADITRLPHSTQFVKRRTDPHCPSNATSANAIAHDDSTHWACSPRMIERILRYFLRCTSRSTSYYNSKKLQSVTGISNHWPTHRTRVTLLRHQR
ncbi:unnamed protein product [Trichogramma brassicae]|uniref:Uncharacterized protein n=1 Tax=Trichogramma brassicae TaxID=86971 RepID=A0A6H5IJR6_9HYME|nr:unnamed protein product [Trichogramma brassicae]